LRMEKYCTGCNQVRASGIPRPGEDQWVTASSGWGAQMSSSS
jgi:hypothetical protein